MSGAATSRKADAAPEATPNPETRQGCDTGCFALWAPGKTARVRVSPMTLAGRQRGIARAHCSVHPRMLGTKPAAEAVSKDACTYVRACAYAPHAIMGVEQATVVRQRHRPTDQSTALIHHLSEFTMKPNMNRRIHVRFNRMSTPHMSGRIAVCRASGVSHCLN